MAVSQRSSSETRTMPGVQLGGNPTTCSRPGATGKLLSWLSLLLITCQLAASERHPIPAGAPYIRGEGAMRGRRLLQAACPGKGTKFTKYELTEFTFIGQATRVDGYDACLAACLKSCTCAGFRMHYPSNVCFYGDQMVNSKTAVNRESYVRSTNDGNPTYNNKKSPPPPYPPPPPPKNIIPNPTKTPKSPPPPPPLPMKRPPGKVAWTTTQRDIRRTGWNNQESILNPMNVGAGKVGMLAEIIGLDGQIYAQPLYVPNVQCPKGKFDLVFVATQGNSIYALDTNPVANLAVVWTVNFGQPLTPALVTCGDINPLYGITDTPVIDTVTNTLYVVANTMEGGKNTQRLYALDISTGKPKFGGKSAPISFTHANGAIFNPVTQMARAGLTLYNGIIYSLWGSHCDSPPYHGWVIAHKATNLEFVRSWCTTSTKENTQVGIWMAGNGPAISNGYMYLATANGQYSAFKNMSQVNWAQSIMKLNLNTPEIQVADFFTPTGWSTGYNAGDADLGSGGVVLVNYNNRDFLAQAGKSHTLYFLDVNKMGKWCPPPCPGGVDSNANFWTNPGGSFCQSAGATFKSNGQTYFYLHNGHNVLFQYKVTEDYKLQKIGQVGDDTGEGATPTITSDGEKNGIVWEISTGNGQQPVLMAYDAVTLQVLTKVDMGQQGKFVPNILGTSPATAHGSRTKFSKVTVTDGKIFIGMRYPKANADPWQSAGALAMLGLTSL